MRPQTYDRMTIITRQKVKEVHHILYLFTQFRTFVPDIVSLRFNNQKQHFHTHGVMCVCVGGLIYRVMQALHTYIHNLFGNAGQIKGNF